jgi:hypothetical protein
VANRHAGQIAGVTFGFYLWRAAIAIIVLIAALFRLLGGHVISGLVWAAVAAAWVFLEIRWARDAQGP